MHPGDISPGPRRTLLCVSHWQQLPCPLLFARRHLFCDRLSTSSPYDRTWEAAGSAAEGFAGFLCCEHNNRCPGNHYHGTLPRSFLATARSM